jgi:tetratricopeptide (TPR) repeat protein
MISPMNMGESLVRLFRVGRGGRVAVLSLGLSVLLTGQLQAGPLMGPSTQFPLTPSGGYYLQLDSGKAPVSLPEHLDAKDRQPLLDRLYKQLREAANPDQAKPIEQEIEQLWLTSGDDNIDFIMQNAIQAMEEEDFVVAEELLDRVIQLAPAYAEGWNKRAMVHFMKKEYEQALVKLRQTLALDPKHFQALHGLALVLQEIGDHRAALQTYRMLLRVHPQFTEAKDAVDELSREVNGQGT